MNTNENLKALGGELYIQFKKGNFVGSYKVNRKFIDNLSGNETKLLMEGFIDERKMHCYKDTEEEHVETFWVMYNETV